MDPNEVLANFVSITGADEAFALDFLENQNFDLETAVSLYLESGGVSNIQRQALSPPKTQPHASHPVDNDIPPELLYGEDEVRAPIQAKAEVLVTESPRPVRFRSGFNNNQAPNAFDMFRDFQAEARFYEAKLGAQNAARSNPRPTPSNVDDQLSSREKKARRLADLYRPPLDLLENGPFDEVKQKSLSMGKWLLVNIQTVTEFDCQKLNRDTWSDKDVKDLVMEAFTLWQVDKDSSEGERYGRFYPFDVLPHIAIIDPRTGERMEVMEGFIDPEKLISKLCTFLTEHTLELGPPKISNNGNETMESQNGNAQRKKTLGERNEDDELLKALELSRQELQKREHSKGNNVELPPVTIPQESTPVLTDTPTTNNNTSNTPTSTPTPTTIPIPTPIQTPTTPQFPPPYDPPNASEESTPIQLRLPGGNTVKQNFRPSDTLFDLNRFVVHSLKTDSNTIPQFTLMTTFPRRTFGPDTFDKTLKELGLLRAVLVVELKD